MEAIRPKLKLHLEGLNSLDAINDNSFDPKNLLNKRELFSTKVGSNLGRYHWDKQTHPNENFNERLQDLSIDDQLDLFRVSGGHVGDGPGGLFHDVGPKKQGKKGLA